ncbi:MAG: Zn-ribbon domain-containing OB-fold protein [Thermodesulfobacteriota bacterium]|nr:Zn-ribbon domain-containing OB-fold protein [Thermodesulfobacteriota bacterium]
MLKLNKKGNPVIETEAIIPYELAMGSTWNRFFEGFKEERIFGTKCPKCERVLVPARKFCPQCYIDIDEWVEVSNEGTVICWSLTNYRFFGMPTEPPFITGFVQLDGADNYLVHLIGGFDMTDMASVKQIMTKGTRVKAVWAENKEGCIMDIKHFKPIKE